MKKVKSVVLQGATQYSNFGDVLYAEMFYEKCKEAGFERIEFWQWRSHGIGSYLRGKLNYKQVCSLFSCLKSDALILFSGGYLWDNKKNTKQRFFRFVFPAMLFQFLHKPVYILGAGGGPVDTVWLRKRMICMLNRSKIVYVRDEETKAIMDAYHVKKHIDVTADTALMVTPDMLPIFEKKESLISHVGNKKKLALHIPYFENGNAILFEKVFPGIIKFLKGHDEYSLVFCTDNVEHAALQNQGYAQRMKEILINNGIDYCDYNFYDAWQMCAFLNDVDFVITMKLHVGVLGASLGKSVISIPLHRDKVHNFYRGIGEVDRCIHINTVSSDLVYEKLCEYYDKPICISDEMREKAKENLNIIGQL